MSDLFYRLIDNGRAVLGATSRALAIIPQKSRALADRIPPPVQVELRRLSKRSARVGRELMAGMLVLGLVAVMIAYGRLNNGPISFGGLVPLIEQSINRELVGLEVEIDDAIVQREPEGAGVNFRLTNIKLVEPDGTIVAQAPLAAVGLSGSALLSGRIAPGSVDFIGPRLLLFYNKDTGLSLKFSRPANMVIAGLPETVIAKRGGRPAAARPAASLNVTEALTRAFENARAGSGSGSYLTRFGVKNATVVFDQNGSQTIWQVPDFAIGLDHGKKRSILIGDAKVASKQGPWNLDFRTEQSGRNNKLSVNAVISDLVPNVVSNNFPTIKMLKAMGMPVTAETSFTLGPRGDIEAATATLRLAGGMITPPWSKDLPVRIDEGDLHIRYLMAEDRIEILPSTFEWGGSSATISGDFRPESGKPGEPRIWKFQIAARAAVLHAEEFGLPPLHMDEWKMEGRVDPESGRLDITRYVMRAGTASVELAGSMIDSPTSPAMRIDGRISAMPLSTFKQFWPKIIAGDAREWIGLRVAHGKILGGRFSVNVREGVLHALDEGGDIAEDAFTFELAGRDLVIGYVEHMPPLLAPEATLRIEGRGMLFEAPRGTVPLPSGQEISLSAGRFLIHDMRPEPVEGEIELQASAATAAVLELLDHKPLGYVSQVGLKADQFGGRSEGTFRVFMPLVDDLKFSDVRVRGATRLSEVTADNVLGTTDVDGGVLDINLTEYALEAQGDVSIKGVPAQLGYQRFFTLPDDKQPPLRLSATLDEAARDKLNLPVNHILKGQLPLTLLLQRNSAKGQSVRLQADLTNVEVALAAVGWSKKPGVSAQVEFDVDQHDDGSIDLRNVRVLGDQVAIEGLVSLDPAMSVKSFAFPDFSFNLQTHIAINGLRREDGVLEVSAKGPSFDGRQFFDSLLSADKAKAAKPDDTQLDFSAEIGNVVGHHGATMRDARFNASTRNGKLVKLNMAGQLNGRAPLGLTLSGPSNKRVLRGESRDAGSAFRLVGFFSKVEGGEASLEMNLDDGRPGESSGTLWARNFVVVNDAVVGEVLSDANSQVPGRQAQPRPSGSRMNFDQLRAPFRIGGGQIRLGDSYINGPLLGATIRGTVDFNRSQLDLGGTYVPLYGLNAAFSDIPLLGPLLSGRRGEGVFGITFAVQGSMDDPNVLVNPLSMVAPGFLRQIFEIGGGSAPQAADQAPTAATGNPWQ